MSKKIDLKTVKGREFVFSIPEPTDVNSFFIFSLPKAGSTLLMKIMIDVCDILRIPTIDLPTHIFTLGIQPAELTTDINRLWQERGYAYVGFRSFLPAMKFDFSKTKNILLIRDPRDMLVSLFFSMKYSHVVPKVKGESHPLSEQRAALEDVEIDHAVLNMAQAYRNYFQVYIKQLPAATTQVYRYEDIIFRKREWIEDMLKFLNLELPDLKIKAIADKHDIRPDIENPLQHIRQVTPGNYKFHLSPTTVVKLDELFRPVMRYFHYDSVVSLKMGESAQSSNIQCRIGALDEMDDHVQRLEQDLEAMHQSRSWRVTSPIRRLSTFLRGNR